MFPEFFWTDWSPELLETFGGNETSISNGNLLADERGLDPPCHP